MTRAPAVLAALALAAATAGAAPAALHPRALRPSLALLAPERPEAARALAWSDTVPAPLVALDLAPGSEALVVADDSGARLAIDCELALDLEALSRHHDGVERARREPVDAATVGRALRSPGLAAELGRRFDRLHRGPRVRDRIQGERTKPFEPGGIAYLASDEDGGPRLRLVEVEDPIHRLALELLAARGEPERVRALLAGNLVNAIGLDPYGLVVATLERYPRERWDARADRALGLALESVAASAADSHGFDDRGLARAVAAARPAGRYLGWWHGHPGLDRGGPGDVPSDDDRRIARLQGRYLTVVERPDGFLVWDLRRDDTEPAPVAVRLAPAR